MEAFSFDYVDLVNEPIQRLRRIFLHLMIFGDAVAYFLTKLLRYFVSSGLADREMRRESSLIAVALGELSLQSSLQLPNVLIGTWSEPHSLACSTV